jgi:hypothetical protein
VRPRCSVHAPNSVECCHPDAPERSSSWANLWDKAKDVAGKVADATVDGAKAAGNATADVAKAAADKTADAAKATANAIKKD